MQSRTLVSSICLGALALSCAKSEPATTTLAAHDVSMLLPLPETENDKALIGFADDGGNGALIPQWAIDALPKLADDETASWAWAQLRAVGVRFDPCFAATEMSGSCKNQVRIVWQPVSNDPAHPGTRAMDAAVHTFYDVSRDELVGIVKRLRASSGLPQSSVLSVHPTLATQGLNGVFAQTLRREVLALTGEKRLTRMTYMALPTEDHAWTFGGFDVLDANARTLRILRPTGVAADTQTVRGSATSDTNVNVRVEPGVGSDNPLPVLSGTAETVSNAMATASLEAALRLENPRITSAESADCASCHVARVAHSMALVNFGISVDGRKDAWVGLQLAHASGPARSFRGFGYFGHEPSISERTAHETAEVIRLMDDLGVF